MMIINYALRLGDIRGLPPNKKEEYINQWKKPYRPLFRKMLDDVKGLCDDTLIEFTTWGWQSGIEWELERRTSDNITHEDQITKHIKKYENTFEYIDAPEILAHPWPLSETNQERIKQGYKSAYGDDKEPASGRDSRPGRLASDATEAQEDQVAQGSVA